MAKRSCLCLSHALIGMGAPIRLSSSHLQFSRTALRDLSMSRKRKQQPPSASPVVAESTGLAFKNVDAITVGMQHLKLAAPELSPLIESFGAPERLLAKDTSCFRSLAKSIIYQQLAGSAAAAIYARFLTACGVPDESHLTPAAVLAAPLPSLRACGLSERKASYLVDLAAHFQDGRLSDELLTSVSDAELLQLLTAVRGIGPWTVDMFAMFHLGHPNILPVGDLGVRKGLAHLCGLKHLPSPEEMHELTAAWQPYRSLGCYYMWRIPLPPQAARQYSKGNGSKGKSTANSKTQQQLQQQEQQELYRAPAPAFPLGGAVPAVADVGVNPLAPVLAAADMNHRGAAAAAAVSAAAAAALAAGGSAQNGQAAAELAAEALSAGWLPEQVASAAAAGAGIDMPAAVDQSDLQITPTKPLAPLPTTAALGEAAAAAAAEASAKFADQGEQGGGDLQATAAAAAAAAAAAGGGGGGVVTRRRLRWAQQQASQRGSAAAGAEAAAGGSPTAGAVGYKARIVDL